MSCLNLPQVTLPDLSLLLPDLEIEIPDPHVGLSLCCELSLTIPIDIPPLGLSLGLILLPYTAVILLAVDDLNTLLDSIQVSCPLE